MAPLPKVHLFLMFILPFSNEIANALTISQEGVFKRLYKPCRHDINSKLRSSLIDLIALFGIVWNVSYMASKFGTTCGCIYGIAILILSFIIPNALMEPSVNYICDMAHKQNKECTVIIKSIASFSFIIILLSIEIIVSNHIKKLKWKYSNRGSK